MPPRGDKSDARKQRAIAACAGVRRELTIAEEKVRVERAGLENEKKAQSNKGKPRNVAVRKPMQRSPQNAMLSIEVTHSTRSLTHSHSLSRALAIKKF